jgi:hypothetical protein
LEAKKVNADLDYSVKNANEGVKEHGCKQNCVQEQLYTVHFLFVGAEHSQQPIHWVEIAWAFIHQVAAFIAAF